MEGRKAEVFLSYCWEDEKIVDEVYDNLIKCTQINLHRDKLEIKQWGSIREYMQSITQMDYVVLFISEAYLKSPNCMYEVLEIMRDREYKDKIFPAVIYTDIYKASTKVRFVKYWQDKLSELENDTKGIKMQNAGSLPEDGKQYQDIAANIVNFLKIVSDMNNPDIKDISDAIKNKLTKTGIIENNIHIFINFVSGEGFNIDLNSGTEVDFRDWYNKIKSGGKIIINDGYVNKIEKHLEENKKSISEEKRKEFHDGIEHSIKCGDIMKIMIRKALLEHIISDKIKCFSDFVKAAADICFNCTRQHYYTGKDNLHKLDVYNSRSESFSFNISDDEYVNILRESKDGIRVPHFVFFDEFMDWVTDKSILENEIIPIYLKINAIRELEAGKEIPVKDFFHWWISIG